MEPQEEDRTRLLPDDVLADVLSRLAPRGLATSRCVCAAWRAVIDGRGLLRADLLPPCSLAGLFINYGGDCRFSCTGILFSRPSSATTSTEVTTSYRMPYTYVQDHCNGLLLLHGAVVNPATGRRAPLPECPPLPTAMERFYREMYLVFDPAAATPSAEQYEVVSIPRPPDPDRDDDDELEKKIIIRPRWPVRGPTTRRLERSLLRSEWPPSPYVLDVFSSTTGRWEKRSFTRDGEAAGTTLADLQLEYRWVPCRRSVYWRGALYVHCENDFVMRISMSNNTYHIIKPPREVSDRCGEIYLHLGRSEKGVYSALYDSDESKLQVWILEESSRGVMEWILRHESSPGLLQASLNCRRQKHGPWILRGLYNRQRKEPVQHSTFDEWNSDDDDSVLNVGDGSTNQYCSGCLDILGFHPYKEIVFLHTSRLDRGLAYHLKTSKLEDLGDLYPPRSNASRIDSCVPYTPCLAGELPESL
ncbi:hypothetical protein BDA96_01G193200 [Sorghum bicolor]|uniref:F-box domain-containing protein n=1 Tax=Sorghum bicolor TaxID=4558 RepID=A0A921UZ40_SORBI|nr:hypothetical protein BDA96_01G193200 [Sorghum bicolor]